MNASEMPSVTALQHAAPFESKGTEQSALSDGSRLGMCEAQEEFITCQ